MQPDDFWAFAEEHCTDRELRVLRMHRNGYQTWEIAEALGLSPHAVRMRYKRAITRMQRQRPARHGWSDT